MSQWWNLSDDEIEKVLPIFTKNNLSATDVRNAFHLCL